MQLLSSITLSGERKMGILSRENGFSLTEESERKLVTVGTVLFYEDVNVFGKPDKFFKLKVIDKKIALEKWMSVLAISILGLLFKDKVILAYNCINLETRKECIVIGCYNNRAEVYQFYLG